MATPGTGPRRRLTGRLATWGTVGGLGVVLCLFASIAIAGAVWGERAAQDVRASSDLTRAYLTALDAFSQEDEIEDVYKDDPDPALRPVFAAAARRLDAALAHLETAGTPRDRELARAAQPLHAAYASAMEDIFDAADRGHEDLVEKINDERADPAQDELQPLVHGTGPDYAIAQLAAIDDMDRTQETTRDRTAMLVPVGAALYVVVLAMFVTLRRRIDRATAAELAVSLAHARTDELTGLGNRRRFVEDAQPLLRAAAEDGDPVGVLLVDLDRFKEINDVLGHQTGDELLRELARRLGSALPEASLIARLGGDEFVVVTTARGGATAARRAGERLLAALDEPFVLDGLTAHVRASVGVALAPDHGADHSTLLRHADVAMYRAKAAGGGVEVFAESGEELSLEQIVLAGELHAALDDDQLILHYQPKAELGTGRVTAVEGLVRWEHPVRGLLPPAAFLPLAERHALMGRLTMRVLGLAAAQAAAWQRAGRPLRVAINLAPANLLDVGFPDAVAEVLARTGVAPELLQLEITEDTIMVDPVRVLDVVARLGELGLRFALDDFGTGYSSLAYLKRLPIEELKIDRSFVMEMHRSRDDAVIVRSTVDLGRNLGLRVVAEGVETQETWEQLAAYGCHVAQGYYLSPPLPAGELTAWLAAYPPAARAA